MGYSVPPPPPKPQKGANSAYRQMAARWKVNRQIAADVLYWARANGVDPIYVLAVMLAESGANPRSHPSSAGALGIMQVMPGIHKIPFGPRAGQVADKKWLSDYSNNVRLGIFLLASAVKQVGYARAYSGVRGVSYNYGGGTPYLKYSPKNYIFGSGGSGAGQAPEAAAQAAADRQAAKAGNPYLRGQAFLDLWHTQINPLYEAYTGRMATRAEARQAIGNGWSDYHIRLMLSQRKSFIGSPVWKSFAPGYAAAYQAIYGDRNPDDRLISYAIVHNLGATGFQQMLRQGKGYVKSEEFAQNVSSLDGVYRQIYGSPDVNGTYVIKQATLAGWSQDQFAKYLRAQPEYQHSSEYQNNASQLASVFGGAETMTLTQALQTPAPTSGVPHDKRLGPAPWEEQQPPPKEKGKELRAKPVPKRRGPPPMKAKAIDPRTMRGAY